jgi:hypothetical protein
VERLEDVLRRFNRKERFILAEWLLSPQPFQVGSAARQQLASALAEPEIDRIPADAFVAIDYHLDWLFAALAIFSGAWPAEDKSKAPKPDQVGLLTASQEDIDALIAWTDPGGGGATVVLIEAKAYTGWTNKQLLSKATRLSAIFGPDGTRWAGVRPRYVLAGPKPSKGIRTEGWARWLRDYVDLPLPAPVGPRSKVQRCTAEGTSSAEGDHVQVLSSPWPG